MYTEVKEKKLKNALLSWVFGGLSPIYYNFTLGAIDVGYSYVAYEKWTQ